MIILFGALIVVASVAGGFVMAGGNFGTLMHLSELVIIGGAALGAMIMMAPKKVLMDLVAQVLSALKGTPYNRKAYDELFKTLYELFLLGRRNGLIALEEHLTNPATSDVPQSRRNSTMMRDASTRPIRMASRMLLMESLTSSD